MKKIHLILTIGLTLFLTSAWAEKYEYVHLKGKTEANQTLPFRNGVMFIHDSFTLASGDAAEVISTHGYTGICVQDDEGDLFTYTDRVMSNISSPKQIFAGPCTIYLVDTNDADLSRVRQSWRIKRASSSGSTTLAWSGTEWTNPTSSTQVANNNSSGSVQYDTLLGWCYFTDTPWLYSYTNGSWYYMKSINNEVYVWNANIPDGGWTKFRG